MDELDEGNISAAAGIQRKKIEIVQENSFFIIRKCHPPGQFSKYDKKFLSRGSCVIVCDSII